MQRLFFKFDFYVPDFKFRIQIGLINGFLKVFIKFAKPFFRFFHAQFFHGTVDLVAAVHADAAVSVQQRLDDFFFRFQPGSVGPPASFVTGRQHAPGCGVHRFQEIPLQYCAILRSIIHQHRFDLFMHKQIGQPAVNHTQPVAEGHADPVYPAGRRRRPAYQTPYQGRIVGI